MKIGLVSLGCPKNLVDSEVMLGLVTQAGHTLTNDPADADVLIVNTCAFIDAAKQESIDAILEMAAHKARRGGRLVVTGCLAERYGGELLTQIPEIDALLGTNDVPRIVAAIERSVESPTPIVTLQRRAATRPFGHQPAPVEVPHAPATAVHSRRPTYLYGADTPRILTTPKHYAYVKIAEGCNYSCSFCVIPSLRGAYRSRPVESILAEAERLAAGGVRELLLVSQDSTFYGVDRGERHALARLLAGLDRIDGIEWIRLLYLYPTTLTDETLAAMADARKVVPYVDLPLQHVSRSLLRRMRRPGGPAAYRRLLATIRRRLPGVTLRSTFIVGFPGERDEQFEELCAFVRETAFDHVGVFTYSHEEGTAAHSLTDDVAPGVKRARQRRLLSIQRRLVASANRRRKGAPIRVLVDGAAPEHPLVLVGRHAGQAPEIDSVVYLTETDRDTVQPGTFLEAEVVGAKGYDLVARPLPTRPSG